MTTTLVIEPPAAFINANDRLHWRKKAQLTATWRGVTEELATEFPAKPFRSRVHITVAIRWPDNKRRDPGNWYPTAKACVDGIVAAGLLKDDSDEYVLGPDLRREYPNGTPQVTITITELEEQS
jgi:Holliday junction resolvase RusA-like endonuclease